ncbi:hypothetical protein QYE76_006138 [Lolium multiflorum]|uniref:Uncharacterized protein n=1 Tax=Lolium multiflorum TaxID=4521 RepID=A0AAD8RVA7_LOLMU|nr:hypothetical protein QYE76_006138 [Lolium multiflorum]
MDDNDEQEEQDDFDVREELRYAEQGESSVDDYCWRIKALAAALAEQGEPVEDRVLTLLMLRGLNPRFRVTAAALLVQPAVPSFMLAFAKVHMEEYKQNHPPVLASDNDDADADADPAAMVDH